MIRFKVSHHFHHFRIVEVIDDVFENIAVGHEAEGTKYDNDRNFLLDVRQD